MKRKEGRLIGGMGGARSSGSGLQTHSEKRKTTTTLIKCNREELLRAPLGERANRSKLTRRTKAGGGRWPIVEGDKRHRRPAHATCMRYTSNEITRRCR